MLTVVRRARFAPPLVASLTQTVISAVGLAYALLVVPAILVAWLRPVTWPLFPVVVLAVALPLPEDWQIWLIRHVLPRGALPFHVRDLSRLHTPRMVDFALTASPGFRTQWRVAHRLKSPEAFAQFVTWMDKLPETVVEDLLEHPLMTEQFRDQLPVYALLYSPDLKGTIPDDLQAPLAAFIRTKLPLGPLRDLLRSATDRCGQQTALLAAKLAVLTPVDLASVDAAVDEVSGLGPAGRRVLARLLDDPHATNDPQTLLMVCRAVAA